jgi:3-hydroxybutyrate dehydrogenase
VGTPPRRAFTSPFLLARDAWPALRESGDGRIVVVASVHGLVASPFKAGYVAAKHGVLGLVKTLALEGAEVGIGVSAVCPGYVRTPLVESQLAAQADSTTFRRRGSSRTSSSRRRR